jgi:hypothetical protein
MVKKKKWKWRMCTYFIDLNKCYPKDDIPLARGKFLGCLVSTKGIEANPDKIRAITQMRSPPDRRDVQKLMGQIASLNHFISQLAERSLPFFTILRGSTKIDWGLE